MLIARAPVRISFAGGGTDLPSYYLRYGGAVVSAAIDKYFYVFMTVDKSDTIQIMSSDYQTFFRQPAVDTMIWDGDLALPRAILNHFNIHEGLSVFLASQVPPGTGLGSSSTVAVAIIKAVTSLLGLGLSKHEIAELACFIEIEKLGMPIGKQDQFAAAYGGVNAFTFTADGVGVEPLRLRPETIEQLERNLLLFYTGAARESARVLDQQNRRTMASDAEVLNSLHALKEMALEARRLLQAGRLDAFGELLHAGWEQKKRLASGISTPRIDEWYETARRHGAIGGKITGAGGGGFLMVYCPSGTAAAVTAALETDGLRRMDFSIDFDGAKILVNNSLPLAVTRRA
ncbi:MAG: GHMP kinase [Armatimonadota bacterium]|nr:GHMP kinase [Armatimonadota bacterium]MDR7452268.1 GHMP kinase [Armatimonadota bacterium]MDR7467968.1 GHMP kinase [Armatimonadota bacterium]MDR7494810.1 GHMP kinase [Armatimonadota bacterium]MDR7499236.1 GHMP kinase [Armatimonadota bacterium]